jgi:putative spermidine/putrescine transport system substrate-binding protein
MFYKGRHEELFQDLDYDIIDTSGMAQEMVQPDGVAHLLFSTIIAYDMDRFPVGEHPKGWEEFWDTGKFPGRRALRDSPIGNLEFALIADGVPKDSLYPLDVERAFRKLDQIWANVTVWWQQGQQPIQLLVDGEVDLTSAFNGRVSSAKSEGESIEIEWTDGMMEPEYFVIPKGATNEVAANLLIDFAIDAVHQKRFVETISYGPTNRNAFVNLDLKKQAELPGSPSNAKEQFLIDGIWWATNYDEMLKRWNKWKTSHQ